MFLYVASGPCDVSKLDLNNPMLQPLIFDVADVKFQYCRFVMFVVVSRRRRRRAPDVGCYKH
jgi:hypothetical protein